MQYRKSWRFVRSYLSLIHVPDADRTLAFDEAAVACAPPARLARTCRELVGEPHLAPLLRERWTPPRHDLTALARLPEGTLGRAYAEHMRKNALTPITTADGVDELTYLRQRIAQTHDIWHVILGYGVDVVGEAAIVGFYQGQFATHIGEAGRSHVAFTRLLQLALYGHCALFNRRLLAPTLRAFRHGRALGRRTQSLLLMRWEEQWMAPVSKLRVRLGLEAAVN
jgi:ubiquinone biosynthesis protein Coq4